MTIYSQHPNRGKVQVLATYRGQAGVTSSTVTSLADAALAAPIVDALNRVSALVTVPVSVHDKRDGRFRRYPGGHIAALTDRNARPGLLEGVHSLWYELVKLLLWQALTDLDTAMAAVPGPVRTAIEAELAAEARELRYALAEFSEGIEAPETDERRYWDFDSPFVTFEGDVPELGQWTRESLNRLETGITQEQREEAVADLRVLADAFARYRGGTAEFEAANLAILDEPDGPEGYYLAIDASQLHRPRQDAWTVEVCLWVPDDPEEEEPTSATGEPIVRCVLATRPAASEIAELLDLSAEKPERLAAWADTPVGEVLAGTSFVVTERPEV
ncbi:hypothetical protein BZB76_1859 [Actinomadura pelletieri DSM 43383]|uniref:Uncharacterized protein n=1 Tax=Actinomadura pelletieri DSM 43383 TaxID=1120940 RepID=A0A495QSR8_9ACTN|nr:hypothetical protein [Actinomadura pelletieri]RKS76503.1 hypothetical protein BZB76_1859 [Actinomadura pelletieri DSM 43383]